MSQNRSIFEDVSAEKRAAESAPKPARPASRKGVIIWLGLLFLLVAAMILVGGLTRLTDSGLSITEWKPITGAIPPMSAADWQSEFDKYRQIPEYQLQNKGMSLSEFQFIYWWEWGHRMLGRVVGLVWALGFVWFWLRKQIPSGWTGRLFGLGLLGGLQGAVGWWMVSSGLTGRMVDVASYRLATHLGIAFVILGLIAWFILRLRRDEVETLQTRRQREQGLFTLSGVLTVAIFAQILLGALVAGIDAGRGYIDWPMMGGEFLPSESFDYAPLWSNFFENPALVQFNHRMLGYLVLVLGVFAFLKSRKSANASVRKAFAAMMGVLVLQVGLGIWTVTQAAPLNLAIAHQLMAIILFVKVLWARFASGYPALQTIRG